MASTSLTPPAENGNQFLSNPAILAIVYLRAFKRHHPDQWTAHRYTLLETVIDAMPEEQLPLFIRLAMLPGWTMFQSVEIMQAYSQVIQRRLDQKAIKARRIDYPPPPEMFREMLYADYLNTAHWQELRYAKLDEADHRCQLCYSPYRLQVHHRTYCRLGEELDSDLIVLCATCHARVHNRLPRQSCY